MKNGKGVFQRKGNSHNKLRNGFKRATSKKTTKKTLPKKYPFRYKKLNVNIVAHSITNQKETKC